MSENQSPTAAETDRFVTVDRRADGVAVLRIDHPDRNALSTPVLAAIQTAAEDLASDPPGAVVIWGGETLFSSGGDATEFDHFDAEIGRRVTNAFHGAADAIAAIPRATIAAITGVASGGGLEIALACDFRIAATDARLGQYEIKMGLFPGGGGTQRLPRLVGPSHAKELIFSGDLIEATEALRIGLVNKVAPATEVLDAALTCAASFADNSATARGHVKQLIEDGLELTLDSGLRLERERFIRLFDNWTPPVQ
jgi:enoyl-CoA hydratase/carnithine racemase